MKVDPSRDAFPVDPSRDLLAVDPSAEKLNEVPIDPLPCVAVQSYAKDLIGTRSFTSK